MRQLAGQRIVMMILISSVLSCVHTERLSEEEMKEHGLVGEITNAELCPMTFNAATQSHQKIGSCQWVRCRPVDSKIVCEKSAKPFEE